MPPGWAGAHRALLPPLRVARFTGRHGSDPTHPPASRPRASPPSVGIAAAASRSLNELAVAGVRAMLGFECRRAVVQEPRARHSAMQRHSSRGSKKLNCWRRSSWQFEAGADHPHTVRKISRRPFSTHRTRRPNLEAEHASSADVEARMPGCASKPQPTRR